MAAAGGADSEVRAYAGGFDLFFSLDELLAQTDRNLASGDQAVRAAKRLADQDLVWLEEPTAPDDYAGQARVLREGGVPVAAGENLRSIVEFEHSMAAAGVSYPEPDASNCGGITPWTKVAAMAEARGLPVTSHGINDIHVHLLAAVPDASYLEVHGFGLERFMAEPLRIREGIARAPDRLGHGLDLDFAALEKHRG